MATHQRRGLVARIERSRTWYFVERMIGFTADKLFLWVITGVANSLLPESAQDLCLWDPGSLPMDLGLPLMAAYGLPAWLLMAEQALYAVVFLAVWGATPGMAGIGLRLIARDGGRPGIRRVLLRHLLSPLSGLVFGLGYLWCFVDSQGRTWHDILSGTLVVSTRPDRDCPRVSGGNS